MIPTRREIGHHQPDTPLRRPVLAVTLASVAALALIAVVVLAHWWAAA